MSEIGAPKYYSKRKGWASFKVDPELWSGFKGVCAQRGVSICYVLEGLMMAWIQAQKVQATILQPVHIDLHMQHVVERPKRISRVRDLPDYAREQTWPPNCPFADDFIRSTREVGCLDVKDHVSLEKCWRCYLREGRQL